MTITDEMVAVAMAARKAPADSTPKVIKDYALMRDEVFVRAALSAVAPLIRSAALEEAAKVAEDRLGVRSDGVATAIRALKDDRTPTAGDFV